jgi:hypothetical protein
MRSVQKTQTWRIARGRRMRVKHPEGKRQALTGTEDASLGAMTLKTAAPELKGGEKGKTHSEGWANNGEQAQLTAQEDRA